MDEHGRSGQVVVEPQETTTYTLTAWNEGKKATETVLAKVAASVKINVSPRLELTSAFSGSAMASFGIRIWVLEIVQG